MRINIDKDIDIDISPRAMRIALGVVAIIVLAIVLALLSGCVCAGSIDEVHVSGQGLTSRSAVQRTSGDKSESGALKDMTGGGEVSPSTDVTP